MLRDDQPDLERGRYAARQIVILFVGVEVVVALHYWLAVGLGRAPQQIGRTAIAGLLAIALWRGYGWAKWVILVLAALGIWMLVPATFALFRGEDNPGVWLLGVLLLCYVIMARILLWSPHLPVFMASQRALRTSPPHSDA